MTELLGGRVSISGVTYLVLKKNKREKTDTCKKSFIESSMYGLWQKFYDMDITQPSLSTI